MLSKKIVKNKQTNHQTSYPIKISKISALYLTITKSVLNHYDRDKSHKTVVTIAVSISSEMFCQGVFDSCNGCGLDWLSEQWTCMSDHYLSGAPDYWPTPALALARPPHCGQTDHCQCVQLKGPEHTGDIMTRA